MDLASSRARLWLLRLFFVGLAVFLYLPLLVLVMFSFNERRRHVPAARGSRSSWY